MLPNTYEGSLYAGRSHAWSSPAHNEVQVAHTRTSSCTIKAIRRQRCQVLQVDAAMRPHVLTLWIAGWRSLRVSSLLRISCTPQTRNDNRMRTTLPMKAKVHATHLDALKSSCLRTSLAAAPRCHRVQVGVQDSSFRQRHVTSLWTMSWAAETPTGAAGAHGSTVREPALQKGQCQLLLCLIYS